MRRRAAGRDDQQREPQHTHGERPPERPHAPPSSAASVCRAVVRVQDREVRVDLERLAQVAAGGGQVAGGPFDHPRVEREQRAPGPELAGERRVLERLVGPAGPVQRPAQRVGHVDAVALVPLGHGLVDGAGRVPVVGVEQRQLEVDVDARRGEQAFLDAEPCRTARPPPGPARATAYRSPRAITYSGDGYRATMSENCAMAPSTSPRAHATRARPACGGSYSGADAAARW